MSREVDMSDVSKLSYADLKYLHDRGLISDEQLHVGDTESVTEKEDAEEEEEEPARITSDYRSHTVDELTVEARARGYEVDEGATKTELVKTLQQDDKE
jgi:hypothetical protein